MLETLTLMPEQMFGEAGNRKRMITFYTKAKGSSHIASNKPCQDNGAHYQKDGVHIVVVCDGHGGESYVRSDIGSKLASQAAIDKILHFIETTPFDLLKGVKGAVTAVPTIDPRVGNDGRKREVSELSESELDLLKQNLQYVKAVNAFPEIENAFRTLFNEIIELWKMKIMEHLSENPFSQKEKQRVGSKRIEKAYGTTLMAAVRTPKYWFAFHIGDGKLFACNKLMQWFEPVPWDCNCFLNVTTSLCDYAPVNEFRYAFDGTGNFPLAFALGSDGIDDTFIRTELIQKFYSNLLKVFNEQDTEEAKSGLTKYLSELSKRGSHDDMSVAAIIDTEYLPKALDYYAIISEVGTLSNEKNKKQNAIDIIQNKIDESKKLLEQKTIARDEEAKKTWIWWMEMIKTRSNKKSVYDSMSKEVLEIQSEIARDSVQLEEMQGQLNEWILISKARVAELRQQANELESEIYPNSDKPEMINSIDDPVTNTLPVSEDYEEMDNPNEVYEKATIARLSDEKIAELDSESEAQAKEILNNDNPNKE